jgi:hypothetical protein
MAVFYNLLDKVSGLVIPHAEVDTKMREALGVEPDDEAWLQEWHNAFGIALAVGKDWDYIRDNYIDCGDSHNDDDLADWEQALDIIDYLEGTYTIECGRC